MVDILIRRKIFRRILAALNFVLPHHNYGETALTLPFLIDIWNKACISIPIVFTL